jgi:hypothetical protein
VILGEGFRPGVYEVLWGEAVAGHPGAIRNVENGERGQGQRCRLLTLGGPRDQKSVSRSVVRLFAMEMYATKGLALERDNVQGVAKKHHGWLEDRRVYVLEGIPRRGRQAGAVIPGWSGQSLGWWRKFDEGVKAREEVDVVHSVLVPMGVRLLGLSQGRLDVVSHREERQEGRSFPFWGGRAGRKSCRTLLGRKRLR